MTKITQKPDGTVSFDLTITKEIIAKEYQHALVEAAKTTQIKGFRPGRAPLKMVESQVDQSQLYSHILGHVLSPAYSTVIHEHKLIPLIEPAVTPKSMEAGKDWVMAVKVAIAPEIKLGDYQQIVVAALKAHAKSHPADNLPAGKAGDAMAEEVKEHLLNVIFDALIGGIKFEVSPLLVEEEAKSALSRLAKQLTTLKLSVEDYAKSIKKTPDALIGEYKTSAQANLKLEFILQKMIEAENPSVSDAEVAKLKPQKGQEGYAKYVLQKRKLLDKLSAL